MKVVFTAPATNPVSTPYQPCDGLTMNFYLGGVLPSTTYTVQHFLSNGDARTAAQLADWQRAQ